MKKTGYVVQVIVNGKVQTSPRLATLTEAKDLKASVEMLFPGRKVFIL